MKPPCFLSFVRRTCGAPGHWPSCSLSSARDKLVCGGLLFGRRGSFADESRGGCDWNFFFGETVSVLESNVRGYFCCGIKFSIYCHLSSKFVYVIAKNDTAELRGCML